MQPLNTVYALCYTREKERARPIRDELSRVGAGGWIVWNYPSPLDDLVASGVKMETSKRYLNVILGHYRILKMALELGNKNILVVEDDARFLKDKGKVEEAVLSLPNDYNVALFDHHWAVGTDHKEEKVNAWWSRCLDRRVSSAAYALNEDGIMWMVDNYERCFVPHGTGLRCCDQYFNVNLMPKGFNFYISSPHICIQKPIGKRVTEENDMEAIYRKMGVNTEDYADA